MEKTQNDTALAQRQSVEQEMFALIAEQQSSGMKIGPFCAHHQIPPSRYYYWLRKYRNRQPGENNTSGFTLLKPEPEDSGSLFCELITAEGSRLRFFRPVAVSFLKPLL